MGEHIRISTSTHPTRLGGVPPCTGWELDHAVNQVTSDRDCSQTDTSIVEDPHDITRFEIPNSCISRSDPDLLPAVHLPIDARFAVIPLGVEPCLWLVRDERERIGDCIAWPLRIAGLK